MATEGTPYSRIVTTTAGVDDATQRLVTHMAGTKGYALAVATPGTIIATRTYRPTWVIVLAVSVALLTFLAGLLLLLITRTEALTITLTRQGPRTRVVTGGSADVEMIIRLNAGLRALPDLGGPSGEPIELRDPVILVGSNLMQGAPHGQASPGQSPVSASVATIASASVSPLMRQEVRRAVDVRLICPGCGRPVGEADGFCRGCGLSLPARPAQCQGCGTQTDFEDRFCTGCGVALATRG